MLTICIGKMILGDCNSRTHSLKYLNKFNPQGETAFQKNKEAAATDQYGRDYDNPNFGINPNRLNLSIKDGE